MQYTRTANIFLYYGATYISTNTNMDNLAGTLVIITLHSLYLL